MFGDEIVFEEVEFEILILEKLNSNLSLSGFFESLCTFFDRNGVVFFVGSRHNEEDGGVDFGV